MATNLGITPKIITLSELFKKSLSIPLYQRPYRWGEKEVAQLLNDILHHQHKKEYRLGTLVIHQNINAIDAQIKTLDIVDGQQRFLTLSLIGIAIHSRLSELSKTRYSLDPNKFVAICNLSIANELSVKQLSHNSAVIRQILTRLSEEQLKAFLHFLLNQCTLVSIELNDISEAFQFFDCQNARGKPLEPYDLLKAFHLREMRNENETTTQATIEHWESEAQKGGKLKPSFNKYLFRAMCWLKQKPAQHFTTGDIALFKGINPDDKNIPPYLMAQAYAHILVNDCNNQPIRHLENQLLSFPFSLAQPLLNGRRFFDFINHYINLIERIKAHDSLKEFLSIENYLGESRKGDKYTKNLFLVSLLIFVDKFGDEHISHAAPLCFYWAYYVRLTQESVYFTSIENHATNSSGLIQHIQRSLTAQDTLNFLLPTIDRCVVTKADGLIRKFENYGLKNVN